jgi:hypothetical protein
MLKDYIYKPAVPTPLKDDRGFWIVSLYVKKMFAEDMRRVVFENAFFEIKSSRLYVYSSANYTKCAKLFKDVKDAERFGKIIHSSYLALIDDFVEKSSIAEIVKMGLVKNVSTVSRLKKVQSVLRGKTTEELVEFIDTNSDLITELRRLTPSKEKESEGLTNPYSIRPLFDTYEEAILFLYDLHRLREARAKYHESIRLR